MLKCQIFFKIPLIFFNENGLKLCVKPTVSFRFVSPSPRLWEFKWRNELIQESGTLYLTSVSLFGTVSESELFTGDTSER